MCNKKRIVYDPPRLKAVQVSAVKLLIASDYRLHLELRLLLQCIAAVHNTHLGFKRKFWVFLLCSTYACLLIIGQFRCFSDLVSGGAHRTLSRPVVVILDCPFIFAT